MQIFSHLRFRQRSFSRAREHLVWKDFSKKFCRYLLVVPKYSWSIFLWLFDLGKRNTRMRGQLRLPPWQQTTLYLNVNFYDSFMWNVCVNFSWLAFMTAVITTHWVLLDWYGRNCSDLVGNRSRVVRGSTEATQSSRSGKCHVRLIVKLVIVLWRKIKQLYPFRAVISISFSKDMFFSTLMKCFLPTPYQTFLLEQSDPLKNSITLGLSLKQGATPYSWYKFPSWFT